MIDNLSLKVCHRERNNGGTYVRLHPSHLMPYSETYQSSSEDHKIEPNISQKSAVEFQKVPISEDNDINEDLETLNTNVDHIYPTPPLGQDMTQGQFLSGV